MMKILNLFAARRMGLLALLWLVFPGVARSQSDVVGIYLTWRDDPTTTMTVNWVNLYEHTAATVHYRPKGEREWKSAGGTQHTLTPSVLQVRQGHLEGLEPDTAYEFALGDRPPADGTVPDWFRTMPRSLDRPLRFVTGGDMMHSRAMADAMNRRAGQIDPDFALLGGDLAYADGVRATQWIDWLMSWTQEARGQEGRHIPMILAIGNHEVRGHYNGRIPDDAPYFYGLFSLPEDRSYYALDFGDYLSVIVLDSGHTHDVLGTQAAWLASAIAERSTQQFLFPIYHYPAYGTTKTPEGGRLPSDSRISRQIQESWIPLFEAHGVSAIFENDHHNYKRTHRILNHQRDDERGLLFLGDGAWGVRTRDVPAPGEAWYLAHAEPRRHLIHVILHPDGRAEIDAIDAHGEVFDEVDLDQPRTDPVAPPIP